MIRVNARLALDTLIYAGIRIAAAYGVLCAFALAFGVIG